MKSDRRFSMSVAALLVTLGSLAPTTVHGEPAINAEAPVAPSPEAPPSPVQPAAFAAPAAAAPGSGLPLTAEPPLRTEAGGQRATPRQPLPEWRVLGAIAAAFVVLAAVRVRAGRGRARLPADVFEVLGEAALGAGQSVRIVRFGPKTLLVGVTSTGSRTLAEIVDPQATDCIVNACRGSRVATRSGQRPKPATGQRDVPLAPRAGQTA